MSYEITIKKIEEVRVTKRGEHKVIDRVPWTNEAFAKEGVYGNANGFLERNPLREVYGYAPSYEGTEKRETEVLKQVVEELDLAAVIRAVNGL